MGWACSYTATEWKWVKGKNRFLSRRVVDRQKECDKMLNWDAKDKDGNIIRTNRLLKSAMVGSTYYAAVKTTVVKSKREYVWAAVFLTRGRGSDGTIWGYKDMDETEGPYYYDCPVGILALLTPTDNENANNWRKMCRKNLAKKAADRKNPQPLYAPAGIDITVEGRSWIISSAYYRMAHCYNGVRFSKAKFHKPDTAMKCFLHNFGTVAQKREFADSGRECPPEWKGLVVVP